MRRLFGTTALALLAFVIGIASVSARQRTITIAEMIAASDDYATLQRLLDRAPSVAALLDDPTAQLTFYAPTEAAYNRLFSDSMMTVEWYLRHPEEIERMLLQQIVPVSFNVAAQNGTLECRSLGTMLPENWLALELDNHNLAINHEAVESTAIHASNGLIVPVRHLFPRLRLYPAAGDHSPDGSGSTPPDPRLAADMALQPADGDVRTVLTADGRFTRWLTLLSADEKAISHLDSAGIYTLFIPTDAAFDAHLETQRLDMDGLIAADPMLVQNSIAPGYITPDILLPDITFNAPGFCTIHPDGVIKTSDDADGAYVDGVALTGEVLYADNAVIYIIDGLRPPPFYG